MKDRFYKLRKGKVLAGVLAGLADKFNWNLGLCRLLFLLCTIWYFYLTLPVYLLLAHKLSYKEDMAHWGYHKGYRRRKVAKKIKDRHWFY